MRKISLASVNYTAYVVVMSRKLAKNQRRTNAKELSELLGREYWRVTKDVRTCVVDVRKLLSVVDYVNKYRRLTNDE